MDGVENTQAVLAAGPAELPLVTIGIPSYNRPDMLARAVRSALAQDYENLEIVVSDDASDAETRNVLRRFESDPRFRCVYWERNAGLVANWQRCFELARGDLWLCLSNDDWLEPCAVSKMVAAGRGTGAGLILCGYFLETEAGAVCKRMPTDGIVPGGQFIRDRLAGLCGYPSSEMFRSDLVRQAGGYHDIGYAMDLMLELDVGSAGPVVYVAEPLVHNVRHEGTASETRPVEAMKTLVVLSGLAPSRYAGDVVLAVHHYCIKGIFGRIIVAALALNHPVTRAGVDLLKTLQPALWRRVAASLLNIRWMQTGLHCARKIKRKLAGS